MTIIRNRRDVKKYLEQVNSLHDGYLLSAQFENHGVVPGNPLLIDSSKTVLKLRYLITILNNTVVELKFEGLREWQIQNDQFWETVDSAVSILGDGTIIWTDSNSTEPEARSECSYVIAETMAWIIL